MAAKTKKTPASTVKKTNTITVQSGSVVTPAPMPAPAAKAPAPATKPTIAATPVIKAPAPGAKSVSAIERAKMIEIAAYLIAEKNGFKGDAQAFWLQAEKEVNAKLGKK